jgi:ATP-dependent 26S proteasome regulatory subunit
LSERVGELKRLYLTGPVLLQQQEYHSCIVLEEMLWKMVVGKEAVRVRNTVERASKIAHSIVFIDELDALGKSRGGEVIRMQMRSDDEAEQTPNQLLA